MKIRLFTVPNIITLASLVFGCAAVVTALVGGGRLNIAFWLVVAAAVCDFADGLVARLTRQYSDLGLQLDSLADMVSFGVAPGVVLWVMYRDSLSLWGGNQVMYEWLGWLVFAVTVFSALRLARFNIDKSQASEFRGLPSPAAALAIAALGWMAYEGELMVYKEPVLLLAALVSWLLICPVRMFSLKFTDFTFAGNRLRYGFLAASLLLVILFRVGGIPLAVALYMIVSAARHLYFWWPTRRF
jgi:CDP-diacylglycerol--serine O-phosphatidyltransferase